MGTEAECTAAGSCNDAGNTSPADATACAQLFSDSGSCSDTSHTTEAECTAAGSCNDVGDTSPADATACAQLFSDSGSCTPPSCVLSEGTDCSTDENGNDTGCIYTAPVPAEAVDAVEGSCSDGTYNAAQQSSCSDDSLSTEADCIAVGTCNDFGATSPADEAPALDCLPTRPTASPRSGHPRLPGRLLLRRAALNARRLGTTLKWTRNRRLVGPAQ